MGTLELTGRYIRTNVHGAGYTVGILLRSLVQLVFLPRKWRQTLDQMYVVGVQTLPVVLIVAIFTGMIVALQTGIELMRIGSSQSIASIVPISMCREMGPFITAIILAATVGSAMAAELGTMSVSEEILALEVMSVDPVRYLVLPRVVALAVMCPILTAFVDLVGTIGGGIVGQIHLGVDFQFYISQAIDSLRTPGHTIPLPKDFYVGLFKAFLFGITIAVIGCSSGLRAKGGALGVGQGVQRAVRNSVIMIIILGYVATWFFYFLGGS